MNAFKILSTALAVAMAFGPGAGLAKEVASPDPFGPHWSIAQNRDCLVWNHGAGDAIEPFTWLGSCVDGKAEGLRAADLPRREIHLRRQHEGRKTAWARDHRQCRRLSLRGRVRRRSAARIRDDHPGQRRPTRWSASRRQCRDSRLDRQPGDSRDGHRELPVRLRDAGEAGCSNPGSATSRAPPTRTFRRRAGSAWRRSITRSRFAEKTPTSVSRRRIGKSPFADRHSSGRHARASLISNLSGASAEPADHTWP